jgi:sec-independent protein translocase protein TatC
MLALAVPMAALFLVAEALAHVLDRRKAKRVLEGDGEIVLHDKALDDLDKTSD